MKAKVSISKSIILVSWKKPPEGWAKLNTDRSAIGNWIRGYGRLLGVTNSFIADL